MESCVIKLTEATHKYGNLNIRPCGKGFFPSDVFGGSSKKAGLGTPITLSVEGLSEPIKTDIPTDKKTISVITFSEDESINMIHQDNELPEPVMASFEFH